MLEEFQNDISEITILFDDVKSSNNFDAAPKLYDLCSKVYEKYEPSNDHRLLECFKSFLKLVVQILFFMSYANTYSKEQENVRTKQNDVRVKKLEYPKAS